MRWLVYGGFAFFVLMPAIVQGLQWNFSLTLWNREFAAVMEFPVFEEFGDSGTGVVLLVFQWTFFTSVYVFLVGLFGGVRLLIYSFRAFGWQFWLAFAVWLGLVAGVLWWGGFWMILGSFGMIDRAEVAVHVGVFPAFWFIHHSFWRRRWRFGYGRG